MKPILRCIFIALLFGSSLAALAQPYGNEWIDYSKTYYKLRVGKEGIYRVTKAALTAAGLPSNTPGAQFKLFRDGQEQPIYVTTTGSFGANDYIEFYGRKADGKTDKELYADANWQPDDRISLFSDTASYFLTYDSQTPHLRYAQITNNIPSSPPPALTYCVATSGSYFLDNFSEGKSVVQDYFVPLSIFDDAEGYADTLVNTSVPLNNSLSTPGVVSSGPNALVRFSVLRNTFNSGAVGLKAYLNSQLIADSTLQPDATHHFSLSVPASVLSQSNSFQFTATPNGTSYDVYGISFLEVRYPHSFDMGGSAFFSFGLEPSASQQYIEFTNFSTGSTAPRLYDLTNSKWYAGNTAVAGKVRFYIDASPMERELLLYSETSSSIVNIPVSKTISFTDYGQAASQGDYIIITHKNYEAITGGHNYIQDYKDYRSSVSGGSRQVVVADVEELYDQFAYGNDIHPLSIRHFLQYAYDHWTPRPHDVFLIGKGLLYHKYRAYLQNMSQYPYAGIVPTYGDIGSDVDFVNFGPNKHFRMNVGRFSAWNPQEVGAYLDKITAFEAAMNATAQPTEQTDLWKKQVLHLGGGKTASEQNYLLNTLNMAADIIRDTSFGAIVTTASKTTTNPTGTLNSAVIDSMVNNGLSLITYHGHATPNGFELNLNNPEQYNSTPKFPHFIALGCDIAQIFNLTTGLRTYSERYLLSATGGAISMISSNNLQYPSFHANYLPTIYKSMSQINYGGTIGDHHRFTYDSLRTLDAGTFNYFHLESMLLQGDPAAPVFGLSKTDYHIASNRLSTIPGNVTTTLDSFTLKIVAYNLGKAVRDTVGLKVEHINPAGTTTQVGIFSLVNLFNTDTITVKVPVNQFTDLGLNKYKVTIDYGNDFDEVSEANNTGTLELFIYSDNLVPVYPKEFSIEHSQNITLKASTLNPFRISGRYRIELDTTEQFNSPLKQQTVITSAGGVIKWKPTFSYQDSTVYYWRTSFDSTINGNYQWSYSSFIYLANGSDGWNQSHYYQYLKNSFTGLDYGTDRKFRFQTGFNKITASNAVYSENGATPWNTADFSKVMFNGGDIQRLGCWPWDGTIQVLVFDSVTNAPWRNDSLYGTSGAYPSCNSGTRDLYAFEFPVWNVAGRNNARHFLDSIPNGHYVLIKNIINLGKYTPSYVDDWKTDPGPSLYQEFQDLGFTEIDSFNQKRVFVFMRKKGSTAYPVYQYFGQTMQDTLVKDFYLPTLRISGQMNSVVIGPALQWKRLLWKSSAADNNPQNDKPYVRIRGIDTNNVTTLLYQGYTKDTGLGFINAALYPNIRMEWISYDSINLSSPQLNYWRVLYTPVPEAALNPAAYFAFNDSANVGEEISFSVAIENISDQPMDSMLVKYKVIDANSNPHTLAVKRYRKLPANDTLHASVVFDAATYPGQNTFFIEANPDNDQPEQYHPNNLGYVPFKVITDERNPLLDVTFDGVHILDRDIISSRPFIKVRLKDENQYLKLDDTSLLSLKILYPDDISTPHTIWFDGTVCKFIPAKAGANNEAEIEYRPVFSQDGLYTLIVNGRDRTGNVAGEPDYRISFEVINKSTITNILNYPNPFSTSTAFVFTLTGSQLPSQFKIQILTVTGKVVREITKPELGPIHIGRNITEYKWDGRDQYGQMLGNGVYLYRVVTSLNGNDMERRESGADKFYHNGYGKMYIMR